MRKINTATPIVATIQLWSGMADIIQIGNRYRVIDRNTNRSVDTQGYVNLYDIEIEYGRPVKRVN